MVDELNICTLGILEIEQELVVSNECNLFVAVATNHTEHKGQRYLMYPYDADNNEYIGHAIDIEDLLDVLYGKTSIDSIFDRNEDGCRTFMTFMDSDDDNIYCNFGPSISKEKRIEPYTFFLSGKHFKSYIHALKLEKILKSEYSFDSYDKIVERVIDMEIEPFDFEDWASDDEYETLLDKTTTGVMNDINKYIDTIIWKYYDRVIQYFGTLDTSSLLYNIYHNKILSDVRAKMLEVIYAITEKHLSKKRKAYKLDGATVVVTMTFDVNPDSVDKMKKLEHHAEMLIDLDSWSDEIYSVYDVHVEEWADKMPQEQANNLQAKMEKF